MAIKDRTLLEYLPPFMQEYLEIKHIMAAEQPEFEGFFAALDDGMNDKFISTATEKGIARWESIYKVTPKDTDTLEERRFRLQTKMNFSTPYTILKLKEALSIVCGAENFMVDLQPENYHIEIRLALTNLNNYQEVVELLKKMIPANLTQWVQIMYNNNEIIGQFTHVELAAYTHKQIKERVFEDGNLYYQV